MRVQKWKKQLPIARWLFQRFWMGSKWDIYALYLIAQPLHGYAMFTLIRVPEERELARQWFGMPLNIQNFKACGDGRWRQWMPMACTKPVASYPSPCLSDGWHFCQLHKCFWDIKSITNNYWGIMDRLKRLNSRDFDA